MAKAKNVGGESRKITFGKRKSNAKKSFNKHDKKEKNYRGQGK